MSNSKKDGIRLSKAILKYASMSQNGQIDGNKTKWKSDFEYFAHYVAPLADRYMRKHSPKNKTR